MVATTISDYAKFEGWYIRADGTTEALMCPQGTFSTSGSFAGCCDKTKCPMPTACQNNTLSFDNFAVDVCQGSASCQTMSIMSAPGARSDVTSSLFCARVWYAVTAYRDTVPVTTSSATKTTSTSASAGSTPTSDSASLTTSPSSTGSSGPTSPAASADPSSGGGASMAWIAGAVVGGVAGLALLAVAFWFLRRRGAQKKKLAAANAPQEIGGYERPADYGDGNWQNKQYFGASHPKSESTSAGYYAPVQQHQVHELPSGEQRGGDERVG